MGPRETLESIQTIYSHLADSESRNIYAARLLYNLSGNDQFYGNDETYLMSIYRIVLENIGILQTAKNFSRLTKVLFGAGRWGRRLLQLFPDLDIRYVVDNNLQEENIQGIPVLTFDEMIHYQGDIGIIISSTKYCEEMYQQLLEAGIAEEKIWLLGRELKEWENNIVKSTYFDLPVLFHDQHEIFVDAGGFDGMTTLSFREWSHDNYDKIYIFEPNEQLYEECKTNLAGGRNIELKKVGLWSHSTTLKLHEDIHHQLKMIDLDRDIIGREDVPVVSLDDCIKNEKVTFIKMDIEGAEQEALKGASGIIRNYKPKIALSVYHKKDDLWQLPMMLLSYRPDYRFYLSKH